MRRILKNSGLPFKTRQAAAIVAGKLKLPKERFTLVPVPREGFSMPGYAIDTDVELESTTVEEAAMETEETETKRVSTAPWKPASYIEIPKHLRKPGFRYRFCNTDKPGNIAKKEAEGWEIDRELSQRMKLTPTIQDGGALDSTTKVRELVVMRMPEEMAKAREEYFASLNNRAIKETESKFKRDASEGGSYGEGISVT